MNEFQLHIKSYFGFTNEDIESISHLFKENTLPKRPLKISTKD